MAYVTNRTIREASACIVTRVIRLCKAYHETIELQITLCRSRIIACYLYTRSCRHFWLRLSLFKLSNNLCRCSSQGSHDCYRRQGLRSQYGFYIVRWPVIGCHNTHLLGYGRSWSFAIEDSSVCSVHWHRCRCLARDLAQQPSPIVMAGMVFVAPFSDAETST